MSKHKPHWVFHLPAILSASAEATYSMGLRTLRVNVGSFVSVLRLAHQHQLRLFIPSTIAVFGSNTPRIAPDTTMMHPSFLYGITKVYNELLGDYFHQRYGVDFRCIRLPGVISANASIGGAGTTDYAIHMLQTAILGSHHYNCYLKPNTTLPMVHIDDCIQGMIQLMGVDRNLLTRSVYNINSVSFDPTTLKAEIERQTGRPLIMHIKPDHRQAIADSWPDALDDTNARRDWGWSPKHNLSSMVASILTDLEKQKSK